MQVAIEAENRAFETLPEGVDIFIHRGPTGDPSLIARRLPSVNLWLCASPAYLEQRGIPTSIHDLYNHDIVDREVDSTWTFDRDRERVTFRAQARVITGDATVTLGILEEGFGIARLPDYLARTAIADGALRRVLSDHKLLPQVDITALRPSHRSLSARVRIFLDELASYMTESQKAY